MAQLPIPMTELPLISATTKRLGDNVFDDSRRLIAKIIDDRQADLSRRWCEVTVPLPLGWSVRNVMIDNVFTYVFCNADLFLVAAFRAYLGAGGNGRELIISAEG